MKPQRRADAKQRRFRPLFDLLEDRTTPAVGITATKAVDLLVADPGQSLTYTVQIVNAGPDATGVQYLDVLNSNLTFGGNVLASPMAVRHSYNAVGNTQLTVDAASGLRTGVLDIDGVTTPANLTLTTGTFATTQGGNVTIFANGSFTYTPQTGDRIANDTFTYTVTDSDNLSSTGTVTLNLNSTIVWYVDSTYAGANGTEDGSSLRPFNALSDISGASGPDAANDFIFIRETPGDYDGNLTLLNGQQLYGGAADLTVNTVLINTAGAATTWVTTGANTNALTLAQNNTVRGFDIGNTTGAKIFGNSIGTATISNVNLTGSGMAMNITTGTLNAAFGTLSTTSGLVGVSLSFLNGDVTASSGSISGSTFETLNISGGSLKFTYGGNISQSTNAALMILQSGHTGTVTFTGTLSATNGNGIQCNNADGTYIFAGTTTLNGGDSGIDIASGASGTFAFGSGTSITNPTGTAFNLTSSNANVTYNGTITDNTGYAVDIDNHDAGVIVFQTGNITSTGTGVRVQNSGGGSVNFNSTNMNLTTTTNKAVDLDTNNAGGTVNFGSGNLHITTTSGAGFSATGGGTVNVTGANNTISSGSGTALNISNTNIGSSNVTFKSISSNGATNGILLNNTGSSGGLKVTGDGTNNASGGTIQNATDGVLLTSTQDVSFTSLKIQNTVHYGITGVGVVNFSFINGTIDNSGTGQSAQDSNIGFNGSNPAPHTPASGTAYISGALIVTGSTLTSSFYHGITVRQDTGTITDLNISNNTFTSSTNAALSNGSAIDIDPTGSATTAASITKGNINNNVITNFPSGAGIQVLGGNANASGAGHIVSIGTIGSGTNKLTISGNSVDGGTNGLGTNAIAFQTNGYATGNIEILNNGNSTTPLKNFKGNGIVFGATGFSVIHGKIDNNWMDGSANIFASPGISIGTDSTFANTDTPHLTIEVVGNHVINTDGNGILATAKSATGVLDIHIDNNFIGAPRSGVRPGIRVDAGNAGSADDAVHLEISGNSAAGSGGSQGIGLRKQGTSATVNDFSIQGLSPSPTGTPTVENFVNAQNPNGNGTLLISATSGFTTFGTVPSPLLAVPAGVESATADVPADFSEVPSSLPSSPNSTTDTEVTDILPPADENAVEAPVDLSVTSALTQDQLNEVVAAAIVHWSAAGLSAQQIAALESATYTVSASLPAGYLGAKTPGHIDISINGGGYGWYVDPTPLDDSEFPNAAGATRLYTTPDQSPAGHFDLLSTVEHEMGHLLGLSDHYDFASRDDLMFGYLTFGERRLPAFGEADGAVVGGDSGVDFLGLPTTIGNLDSGTTINLKFTATINANTTANTITNRGNVTATGGIDISTNTVSTTINHPDLIATKTDSGNGNVSLGSNFTWNIHVVNSGTANATFTNGQVIAIDDLPTTNISYSNLTISGSTATGTIDAAIDGNGTLTLVANGTVTLTPGTGFNASFLAAPTTTGTYANPRAGGNATVDPGNVIIESNEGNNTFSDTVIVRAADLTITKSNNVGDATTLGNAWTWTIHVANAGNANATFSNLQTLVFDSLPTANITYGSVSFANQNLTGALNGAISSGNLTVAANGTVTLAAGNSFDVVFSANASSIGAFNNPAQPSIRTT